MDSVDSVAESQQRVVRLSSLQGETEIESTTRVPEPESDPASEANQTKHLQTACLWTCLCLDRCVHQKTTTTTSRKSSWQLDEVAILYTVSIKGNLLHKLKSF